MKIAILITGQLRTFEMVKYLHMNALIKQYDADVFLGIDVCNNFQNEVNKNSTLQTNLDCVNNAINFFNPIDTFILDDFTEEFDKVKNNSSKINVLQFQGMFRQYYVVKKTYNMLINHVISNCIQYDLILRLRFDQLIFSNEVPIAPEIYDNSLKTVLFNENNIDILKKYSIDKTFTFEEIANNSIYVFGYGDFLHYKYANDQFFYHNHSILIKMFEFYDNILSLLEYCYENKIGQNGAIYECIFYLYITKFNNIHLKKSNISGIFIREFN